LNERVVLPVVPVSTFIYDPDPSLIRAGVLDSFAAAHGLSRIVAGVDYLTGGRLLSTPFLSAFQVQSVHRLDMKRLRRLIAERDLGPLEVKLKGLDLAPETLRSQLRPKGSRPATLILVGGAGPAWAIVARRVSSGCRSECEGRSRSSSGPARWLRNSSE
jgi:hypothetical protein